ncbi:MAG: hypothetical protein WCT25_01825 [Candidatus Paceibacterota bacterium]|jgi:hypothetical protein
MQKKNLISTITAVFVIGLIAWYGFSRSGPDSDSVGGIARLGDKALETNQSQTEATETQPAKGGFWSNVFGGSRETYNDLTSGFSFKYPKEYSMKEIPAPSEGEARTLLLSKDGKAPSVQVAVSPFDEDIVLTVERIQADVPDLGMKNPQEISIGSVTKGVKFDSDTGVNVWFVAKGNLFQLTAFSDEAGVLDQIVSSFKM